MRKEEGERKSKRRGRRSKKERTRKGSKVDGEAEERDRRKE